MAKTWPRRCKVKLPGVEVLSNAELGLSNDRGWGGKAPLWFYVLKEADLHGNGERLGDAGGRIVAEVFLGMLDQDEACVPAPVHRTLVR